MKTQTRLILCTAICALALLALASVPLGTQGKSAQFLTVNAGIKTDSEPLSLMGVCPPPNDPKDPNKPIAMGGVNNLNDLYGSTPRQLMDTLKDLRCRKKDDLAGTCKSQSYLRDKLILIKAAIRRIIELDDEAIDNIINEDCPPPPPPNIPGTERTGPGVTETGGKRSGGTETGGTKNNGGLKTVKFETEHGSIIVNLPDDIRAGDTISGTVIVEPKGSTEQERAKNRSELTGYVVEVKQPTSNSGTPGSVKALVISSTEGTFGWPAKWDIGEFKGTQKPAQFGINLKDRNGSVIGTTTVPFAPPQGRITIATQDNIGFPSMHIVLGQQGRPIQIPGSFDGSFENTKVTVGGKEVPMLAESPRKAIFKSPSDITGPTEIVVKEGNVEAKGPYRNVGVNLSAPKTTLLKGESTELRVEVQGLEGIKEPVPVHLTKGGVVTMQGGDAQTTSIKPAEVSGKGTFTTTRTITGVQAGAWNATATVVVYDICIQDDNDPTRVLLFMTDTGDFNFCPGHGSGGGVAPTPLSSTDFTGGISIQAGDGLDVVTRNGAITAADFRFTGGHMKMLVDPYTHSGTATVQTTSPKRTFTITDRDTRNNTCACK